ncbi:hypothetical protein ILYODFUR_038630, partial [Ilyodon furcidens]
MRRCVQTFGLFCKSITHYLSAHHLCSPFHHNISNQTKLFLLSISELQLISMPSSSESMAEVESVEVVEPEENLNNHRYSQPLDEEGLMRNGLNIWIFLKRNAFVILTMVAVAV